VVAAFYQYLEALRVRVKLVAGGGAKPAPSSIQPPAGSNPRTPLLAPAFAAVARRWPARLAVAAMFKVNSDLGYLLKLAVMSFNGGVFVAVVVGLALGYLACSSGGPRGRGGWRGFGARTAVYRPCHAPAYNIHMARGDCRGRAAFAAGMAAGERAGGIGRRAGGDCGGRAAFAAGKRAGGIGRRGQSIVLS
jgi:hypothetical protein